MEHAFDLPVEEDEERGDVRKREIEGKEEENIINYLSLRNL